MSRSRAIFPCLSPITRICFELVHLCVKDSKKIYPKSVLHFPQITLTSPLPFACHLILQEVINRV